jgi:hypothetical protein
LTPFSGHFHLIMLVTKPSHHFIPTLLVGQVVRSLWLTCLYYADFCMEHMLYAVATGCVINSDITFRMCHLKREDNFYVYMKGFGWHSVLDSMRIQDVLTEVQLDQLSTANCASVLSAWNATELLYLLLCNTAVVPWTLWKQIVKQTWILGTSGFRGCMLAKLTPHLFCLVMKLTFATVNTLLSQNGYWFA